MTDNENEIIGRAGGYRKTLSFGYTCLIYHATQIFCQRVYDHHQDPLGKTVGQMIGAARSARQNLVEASSRAGISPEQELRQLDVARGSLDELAGDYETFLIDRGEAPWSEEDGRKSELKNLRLDSFELAGGDQAHRHGKYILQMRERFRRWLENEDPVIAANSILAIINRDCSLLHSQMSTAAKQLETHSAFPDRVRQARTQKKIPEEGAPTCPICGSGMHKVNARKGPNAGHWFWSCDDYPNCRGTRNPSHETSSCPRG